MTLSAEQIQANWETFINNIHEYITGDRKDKLIEFYNKFQRSSCINASSS